MARGHRIERIQSSLHAELAGLIRTEATEELATGCTISRVIVSGDLSHAEVYFLVHGDQTPEEAGTALQAMAHRLQGMLYHSMHLRRTPRLKFIWDKSMEAGLDLSLRLGQMQTTAPEEDNDDASSAEGNGHES